MIAKTWLTRFRNQWLPQEAQVIDRLVKMAIDRGELVKKLINFRLIRSSWKMETYTNLANLANA